MKKLTLLFAALFTLLTVSAKTIYLKPGANWGQAGWYAAWTWGGSDAAWVTFTAAEESGVFKADLAEGRTGMKLVRMPDGATSPNWKNGGAWNESSDITIPTDGNNCVTLSDAWDGATGSWSTYTPPTGEEKQVETITLSNATLKLYPGHTYQLSITEILPEDATNKEVTWSTTDEQIATVENGRVKAIAAGEPVTITATANDGSGVKAECVVTVSKDEDALKGLTVTLLERPAVDVWIGKTVYVWAWTATGNLFAVWPGEEVAEVDGKFVYTFDANHAKVNLLFNNGKGNGTNQTGDSEITADAYFKTEVEEEVLKLVPVKSDGSPLDIAIESIAWSAEAQAQDLRVGQHFTNMVDVNPLSATNQTCEWTSSDPAVATVEGSIHATSQKPIGKITALKAGTTTISVVFADETNGKKELSYELTVLDKVTFDANGENATLATVPATNEELFELFKADYKTTFGHAFPQDMANIKGIGATDKPLLEEFVKGNWKWLGDYIDHVSATTAPWALGPDPEGSPQAWTGSNDQWRFAVWAFFNQTQQTGWPYSADFTTAGKPEAWKTYYQFATAPTREGYAFTGWYTEPACENKVETLAADFVGTLYAGWVDHIALENVAWETEPATEMIAGTRAELAIVLTPANTTEATCTWTSSHPEIIEVAEGTVVNGKATTTITAKAAGENVTITATFANDKKLEVTINVTEKYTFVLQGGTLAAAPADNDALYEVFKVDYVKFKPATSPAAYVTINGTYTGGKIDSSNKPNGVAGYATNGIIGFLTTNDYGWKWLGDYIIATTPAIKENTNETDWRYDAQGFFSALDKPHYLQTGNYSLAGLPSVWHAAYNFAQVPTKENSKFTGWYDNPEASGEPLTALPAEGGKLYAGWGSTSEGTALENAEATKVAVRKVIENGQIYIIRNGEKYTTTGILVK